MADVSRSGAESAIETITVTGRGETNQPPSASELGFGSYQWEGNTYEPTYNLGDYPVQDPNTGMTGNYTVRSNEPQDLPANVSPTDQWQQHMEHITITAPPIDHPTYQEYFNQRVLDGIYERYDTATALDWAAVALGAADPFREIYKGPQTPQDIAAQDAARAARSPAWDWSGGAYPVQRPDWAHLGTQTGSPQEYLNLFRGQVNIGFPGAIGNLGAFTIGLLGLVKEGYTQEYVGTQLEELLREFAKTGRPNIAILTELLRLLERNPSMYAKLIALLAALLKNMMENPDGALELDEHGNWIWRPTAPGQVPFRTPLGERGLFTRHPWGYRWLIHPTLVEQRIATNPFDLTTHGYYVDVERILEEAITTYLDDFHDRHEKTYTVRNPVLPKVTIWTEVVYDPAMEREGRDWAVQLDLEIENPTQTQPAPEPYDPGEHKRQGLEDKAAWQRGYLGLKHLVDKTYGRLSEIKEMTDVWKTAFTGPDGRRAHDWAQVAKWLQDGTAHFDMEYAIWGTLYNEFQDHAYGALGKAERAAMLKHFGRGHWVNNAMGLPSTWARRMGILPAWMPSAGEAWKAVKAP